MKMLTQKLDYDLFKTLFLDGDLEKAQTMWTSICKNSGFLVEGMQIDKDSKEMCPTFRAPMICFMMLRFPNTISKELYDKLVDTIIRRKDLASSIYVNGLYLDFLSLILVNTNYKLADYQKEMLLQKVSESYGIEEEKRYVSYEELLDMESPMMAKFIGGGLQITVNEYEFDAIKNGEVKKTGVIKKYKNQNDYRLNILTNSNFSEMEREFVQERMYQDEEEFKQFINYYVNMIASKFGLDDLTVLYLTSTSIAELKEQFGSNEELLMEVLFAKEKLDNHYQKSSKLIRSVN